MLTYPQMWAAELEDQNRLARSGENGIKEPSPGPSPLAGFALTTVGRF